MSARETLDSSAFFWLMCVCGSFSFRDQSGGTVGRIPEPEMVPSASGVVSKHTRFGPKPKQTRTNWVQERDQHTNIDNFNTVALCQGTRTLGC